MQILRYSMFVDEKITSDISYVNPTYVKSIEFVDDVSATMHGSRELMVL
ncbi:MAG: hypothetical protein IPH69_17855 [Bacteroidales bacterium]|nr:hypothetical protein [Bacteroidales bacterium]